MGVLSSGAQQAVVYSSSIVLGIKLTQLSPDLTCVQSPDNIFSYFLLFDLPAVSLCVCVDTLPAGRK